MKNQAPSGQWPAARRSGVAGVAEGSFLPEGGGVGRTNFRDEQMEAIGRPRLAEAKAKIAALRHRDGLLASPRSDFGALTATARAAVAAGYDRVAFDVVMRDGAQVNFRCDRHAATVAEDDEAFEARQQFLEVMRT